LEAALEAAWETVWEAPTSSVEANPGSIGLPARMMDRAAAASPQADQSDIFDPCDADMVMTGVDCYDYLGVGLHSTRCVAVDSGYCR
jgi:hypothetical protein